MTICPSCGHAAPDQPASMSNADREVVLRIPERHFALFRKTFREMSTKLGMYGYGELANELQPYGEAFNLDFERLRYFDDGALALASIGAAKGFPAEIRIGEGKAAQWGAEPIRHDVAIDFTFPDGRVKSLRVADNAPPFAAQWFKDHFEDLLARLQPVENKAPSAGP